MNAKSRSVVAACGLAAGLLLAGCRQDMHDQPRFKPYAKSDFFADQRSARPLIGGSVARGHLDGDARLVTGRVGGEPAGVFPFEIAETKVAMVNEYSRKHQHPLLCTMEEA